MLQAHRVTVELKIASENAGNSKCKAREEGSPTRDCPCSACSGRGVLDAFELWVECDPYLVHAGGFVMSKVFLHACCNVRLARAGICTLKQGLASRVVVGAMLKREQTRGVWLDTSLQDSDGDAHTGKTARALLRLPSYDRTDNAGATTEEHANSILKHHHSILNSIGSKETNENALELAEKFVNNAEKITTVKEKRRNAEMEKHVAKKYGLPSLKDYFGRKALFPRPIPPSFPVLECGVLTSPGACKAYRIHV